MIVRPAHEDPVAASASTAVGGPPGRRWAGHPWWTPVRVVLAVTCVAWLLAMVQKAPCAADDWSDVHGHLCYSDMPYLYAARGFAELQVPFADTEGRHPDLEYPVVIGWFGWATAVATHALHGHGLDGGVDVEQRRASSPDEVAVAPGVVAERQTFFLVTAVLLAPFALLSAYFLTGVHRGRPWDALPFAASPALVAAGLINWDLVAVACVAGAFWAWSRGSPVLTGVMVGVGTAAKLYPLFLLGAFLVVALRRRELRPFLVAAGAAVLAWLGVNVPVMLYGFTGWTAFWSFNSERGPDLGSLWLVLAHAGWPASAATVNVVSWALFLGVCVGVLVLGLRVAHPPRVAQLALLVLVGFLLVNKVYSPQYVLWLLPVAVLARPRWRDLLVWQAGELFYFVMVWMYLGGFTASATSGDQDLAYSGAILVRVAAQLYLAAVVLRDVVKPWRDPARLSLGDLNGDPAWPEVTGTPSGRTSRR